MELAFSTNGLTLSLLGVVLLIAGLILWLRHYLGHWDITRLQQRHQAAPSRQALTGRNKYTEVDAFRWTGTFLRFGLLSSTFIILVALNWTEEDREIYIPEDAMSFGEDIEIEVPRSDEPPPPPPPPPPPVIQEVPEDILLAEDQPEFVDQSIDRETKVFAPTPEPTRPGPPPPPPPPPPPKEEEIFVVAEDMPRFPGCEDLPSKKEKEQCAGQKLLEFIYANIQYPAVARENGVEGTVVVAFVVEKDGSVADIKLLRDIGAGCGDEAQRVVKLMNAMPERWIPGKQRGKAVRVQYNLPVKFVLR